MIMQVSRVKDVQDGVHITIYTYMHEGAFYLCLGAHTDKFGKFAGASGMNMHIYLHTHTLILHHSSRAGVNFEGRARWDA